MFDLYPIVYKQLRNILLFSVVILFSAVAYSMENFSVKTKIIIQTEALNLIREYESKMNLIGKTAALDHKKAKSYSEELINLFINRQVMVYNDLDPSKKLSNFYEIETYANNILLWYKGGLEVHMWYNDAKVSNIINHKENIYSIDVLIPKKIDGNYLNKVLNKNIEKLIFRIAFTVDDGTLGNFKIAGLRSHDSKAEVVDQRSLDEINSENLSEEELYKIKIEADRALNDYINYLNLIVDPDESAEDKEFYKKRFMSVFKDENVYVANDLEPKPKEKAIPIHLYLDRIAELYPKGVSILTFNLDSVQYGKPTKSDKNSFFNYIYVDKFFSASPDGKKLVRNDNKLTIKVEFEKSDRSYTNYKIASIVVNTSEYAEVSGNEKMEMPAMNLQENSRKGLSLGLHAGMGMHSILVSDILNQSIENGYNTWGIKTDPYSYTACFSLSYYPFQRMGFSLGISYDRYETTYGLTDSFVNKDDIVYINNFPAEECYNIVGGNYDSLIAVDALSVPLLLNFHTSKAGKFGLFAAGGASFSYIFNSGYTSNGYLHGFYTMRNNTYPYDPLEFRYYDEWNRLPDEKKGDLTYSSINVTAIGRVGVEYYVNYFTSVKLGIYYEQGILDIEPDKSEYLNIFGKIFEHQQTLTKKQGIFIGVNYKL